MHRYKVGDKLTTRAGFFEYVVEQVHDDGSITVVEDWLPRRLKPFARRCHTTPDALIPNTRVENLEAA